MGAVSNNNNNNNNTSAYTAPPPSYQTAATSYHATDSASRSPLLQPDGSAPSRGQAAEGQAPDSDLPDDFKYSTSISQCSISIRNAFVRKVYTILFLQLLATSGMSLLFMFNPGIRFWVQSHPSMMWITLFGSIALLFLTYWKRKSYPTNLLFLGGFTLLEGYSVATITTFYETRIVVEALLITLLIFGGLTVFAMQSKYDFTGWMPFLGLAVWLLIGFGFIAAFFPYSSASELGFGVLGAAVFSGYILVDTQLIMKHYHPEEEIAASISLYLDFINLFLSILRILNSQNNNN
ncbi:inhibitor of apoptosis-promoting Bax1-domain-containing protein [Lipomyces japonicus]|uniref:inhibitor of apoptosis-promoting Bax1-domain-containing protein n=1 Tax=Lipomyces japonicus TaxID=56871 RepID=UPI0034CD34F2